MKFQDNRLLTFSQRIRRLRYLAIGLLFVLLIPITVLSYLGYQQAQANLLMEYQSEASNLLLKTNRNLYKKLTFTNTLKLSEFDYYQEVYNPVTKTQQQMLSPLSSLNHLRLENGQEIVGLVGYFQFDNQGRFNSPIWPAQLTSNDLSDFLLTKASKEAVNEEGAYANLTNELVHRRSIALEIYQILSQSSQLNELVAQGYDKKRHYFSVLFDIPDYFVFYRVASIAGQTKLQGYLVKRTPYMRELITEILEWRSFNSPIFVTLKDVENSGQTEHFFYEKRTSGLAKVSVPLQSDSQFEQQEILSNTLQWPYEGYVLSLSTNTLSFTAAMKYGAVIIVVLVLAILIACFGFYRLGVKQLALSEQRLNFVSSVSHELKTPLTSISMYSQMLKEGAVLSEEYRQDYYRFIFDESERLTRLIKNILQLSSLEHHQYRIAPEYVSLNVLMDIIRSKTSSLIGKYDFQQSIVTELAQDKDVFVLVDPDAFSQIVINITDNAIKFFDKQKISDPSRQKLDFIFRQHPKNNQMIQLEIRDYGEGVTPEQAAKVFQLFYRGGNELTRTTKGTGIGLALVNELVLAQQGNIVVERKTPGLAMLISIQAKF